MSDKNTTVKDQEPIKLKERQRIYQYPGGNLVVLNNVTELVVRPSGDHRLKTSSAAGTRLHILPPGWIHIEIDDSDWTV